MNWLIPWSCPKKSRYDKPHPKTMHQAPVAPRNQWLQWPGLQAMLQPSSTVEVQPPWEFSPRFTTHQVWCLFFFCGASEVRTLVKFLGLTGSAFRHSTSCLSVTQIWSGPCHANFIHQDEFLTWLAPKWTNGTDRLLELKSSIRSKFSLTISDQCPDVVCL